MLHAASWTSIDYGGLPEARPGSEALFNALLNFSSHLSFGDALPRFALQR